MRGRATLLKGANALLYFGPLLAGIGGFGWAVVPIFAAIFMLWLFILRPRQWPRTLAEWGEPEALIAFLTQSVAQVLLVAISFGIGRGIGGVMGVQPSFPLLLPVLISFLSIPLARMIWDPWKVGAVNPVPQAVKAGQPVVVSGGAPEDLQAQILIAARLVAELGHLPEAADPDLLERHLRAMATQVPQSALRVALMDPIYDRTASAVHRRAAIVHATEGGVADALIGTTYCAALFSALSQPEDLQLFALRCATLVAENPDRGTDCPDQADVLAKAQQVPLAAEALGTLAATLSAAARYALVRPVGAPPAEADAW